MILESRLFHLRPPNMTRNVVEAQTSPLGVSALPRPEDQGNGPRLPRFMKSRYWALTIRSAMASGLAAHAASDRLIVATRHTRMRRSDKRTSGDSAKSSKPPANTRSLSVCCWMGLKTTPAMCSTGCVLVSRYR